MSGVHLPFGLLLVLAVVGMGAQDWLGTYLVVAESRGHAMLAGLMDAGGDLASVMVTVVGVGSVLTDGLTVRSITILAVIVVTSYVGTFYATKSADQSVQLSRRKAHTRAGTRMSSRKRPKEPRR